MEKTPLKVLSYNIHKGFGSRRHFTLPLIRTLIREIKPDLVLLQEVLGHHAAHEAQIEDWPKMSQFEFLADEMWPHFAYGRNAVYNLGHHGNAILSKYPIISSENIDISTNPLEQRGLLHAVIQPPSSPSPIHAICVHLGLFEADRKKQIQSICSRIDSHVPQGQPLILGGDFNDWKTQASTLLNKKLGTNEAFLNLHGTHAKTFPSWYPLLRLDRIYYRGFESKTAQTLVEKRWLSLSDHLALIAEFNFNT